MSRNLIPKSSYPELSAIWHNNKTGIILVTTDSIEYYVSGYEYELRENDVLESIILAERQPEPVPDYSTLKNEFIIELRKQRNQKLLESDWTQLVDVQNLFDETTNETTKNQWAIYRQKLRDITEVYLENEIVDINNVNWPSLKN